MTTIDMLDTEFKYFLDHKAELAAKYDGKYIVIVGKNVVGSYNSEIEAYDDALKSHEIGTFLIQLCEAGGESYSHTFHSRAVFK